MEYKPLPIGIDNFKEMIERGCYYVDKTLLMKQLLDTTTKVSLFTRPRRFGKSLNLSMLQYFFERSERDTEKLFQGLNIASAGEEYTKHMGQYPVIMLNFKEAKQATFVSAYKALQDTIMAQFYYHKAILDLYPFEEAQVEQYKNIMGGIDDQDLFMDSIAFLCECLEKAYGQKVILLIDESDVPLENAYSRGFHEEMIDFIRGLLSVALKTNNSLYRAVMTGCLRISKESIFTGLNNLEIISIENKTYGEYFGFTEAEVEEMLAYYNRTKRANTVKDWYNGYLFGKTKVYNPWSLINYMDDLLGDEDERPKPYWSNTSSNSIVRDLIQRIDANGKIELETLMAGGTIEKAIQEDITYADIHVDMDHLWNFLYFTGYLKKVSERFENRKIYATMQIPNEEVAYIYENHIVQWMNEQINNTNLEPLYQATITGNAEGMEQAINQVLIDTISYHDGVGKSSGESFYHGVMLGLYRNMKQYLLASNRESGNGRPDLIIKYPSFKGKAFLLEFKVTKEPTKLEEVAQKALGQIKEQDYKAGLLAEGYTDITSYGIGFCQKCCVVVK
ncbi:MAG: AAA family ATPase [Eubacteriales bacterium]